MIKRNIYLQNKPLEEALVEYLHVLRESGALDPGPAQTVPVADALGRVTAQPVFALNSVPHYFAAAMDGVALSAESTYGTSESCPVHLELGGQAFPVDTGDPLPVGCNAVVMAEHVHYPVDNQVEIIAPVAPWQHVRTVGEDMTATEMILPAGHLLKPFDLGAMLAGGITEVDVYPRTRVAILPTGTELVPAGVPLRPGDIVEFNGTVLSAMIRENNGEACIFPSKADSPAELRVALERAVAEYDTVLINAGSSAGRDDYTAALISELGEVFTHGVAVKPGKPVILGMVNKKPVLGIPGYPVSTVIAYRLFARPVILAQGGLPVWDPPKVRAILSRKLFSTLGMDEFVRVRLGQIGERLVAVPMARGAGVTTSLVRADGLMLVPRAREGFLAGSEVTIELLRSAEEIRQTIVVSGSHDLCLDVLGSAFHATYRERYLSSSSVGSFGGLQSLQRREAHCAGIHLLDEETGEYNISYLERFLQGIDLVLINLVYRQQGLIVARGNPLGIAGLEDLSEKDVEYINRQGGSGTRILLDYHLKNQGISPDQIRGYQREEYTHLGVAAAVAGGAADAGLGILAAARALNLDFVPVAVERYDLCFPAEFWSTEAVRQLVSVMRSPAFREQVSRLGGYDLRDCGRVLWQRGGVPEVDLI
ncbi:MAG: molybdopterin biosynthesis protein [Bacillota bacterium]